MLFGEHFKNVTNVTMTLVFVMNSCLCAYLAAVVAGGEGQPH